MREGRKARETGKNQSQRDGRDDPNQERTPALFKGIVKSVCLHSITFSLVSTSVYLCFFFFFKDQLGSRLSDGIKPKQMNTNLCGLPGGDI